MSGVAVVDERAAERCTVPPLPVNHCYPEAVQPQTGPTDGLTPTMQGLVHPGDMEVRKDAGKPAPPTLPSIQVKTPIQNSSFSDQHRHIGTVWIAEDTGDMSVLPVPSISPFADTPGPTHPLPFTAPDLYQGCGKPEGGDVVEYALAMSKETGAQHATDVRPVARGVAASEYAARSWGFVSSLFAAAGTLKEAHTNKEWPFDKVSVRDEATLRLLEVDSEVNFVLGHKPGHQGQVALDLVHVPPGTLLAPQTNSSVRGAIVRMPEQTNDLSRTGLLRSHKQGKELSIPFGLMDVHDFVTSLSAGDEVLFEMRWNPQTCEAEAAGITLLQHPETRPEFGRVSMLRNNFGFIKCCERITDMFFHVNAVKASSAPVDVNMDVRFVPRVNPDSGKLVATEVEVQPPGTAVFEVLSQSRYPGTIKIVCGVPQGNGPTTSGIVVAVVDGRPEMLPYSFGDVQDEQQPVAGSQVTFRVLEDRKAMKLNRKSKGNARVRTSGRRAVELEVTCLSPPSHVHVPRGARPGVHCLHSPRGATLSPSGMKSPREFCSPRSTSDHNTDSPSIYRRSGNGLLNARNAFWVQQLQPSALVEVPPGRKTRGTVLKIVRNPKKLPTGEALGVLRPSRDDWFKKREPPGAAGLPDAQKDHPATGLLRQHGLDLKLRADDVLFWLSNVRQEFREAIMKKDEVEFHTVPLALDNSDSGNTFLVAIDVVRLSLNRPPAMPQKPQILGAGLVGPNAGAGGQGAGQPPVRRAPKFSGPLAAVQVPGPEKGAKGFQAGRGKVFQELKAKVAAFRFEDALQASAFIPRSNSNDSFKTCVSFTESPVVALEMSTTAGTGLYDSRFDDAE